MFDQCFFFSIYANFRFELSVARSFGPISVNLFNSTVGRATFVTRLHSNESLFTCVRPAFAHFMQSVQRTPPTGIKWRHLTDQPPIWRHFLLLSLVPFVTVWPPLLFIYSVSTRFNTRLISLLIFNHFNTAAPLYFSIAFLFDLVERSHRSIGHKTQNIVFKHFAHG